MKYDFNMEYDGLTDDILDKILDDPAFHTTMREFICGRYEDCPESFTLMLNLIVGAIRKELLSQEEDSMVARAEALENRA